MISIAERKNRERVRALTMRENALVVQRTRKSAKMLEVASRSLSGGVASSYQFRKPCPIYIDRGNGPVVWDVDGNEMWDFHNGFGSMIQGHAHPAIGYAVRDRYTKGTHFAAPTEDGIIVADELQRRWGLGQWRYTNSGSEATMDAIRIARGFTGRDTVMKIFGSYHGHHDAVMVSIAGEYETIGHADSLVSVPFGAGIPKSTVDLTVAVPYNDAAAMERRIESLIRQGRKPACVIMEAVPMNMRVILPEPGYLEAVREITSRYGIVLIFDEVKTGLSIASGGATERFGVRPDLVTLAKALGAGLPMGAVGGTEDVMSVVKDGRVYQVGTFNGNPMCMSAARANLLEVLTPEAYTRLEELSRRLVSACNSVLADSAIPGYSLGLGAKGCVTFSASKIVDYRSFQANRDEELSQLFWLYCFNRGIYTAPNRDQEWTLSVVHTAESVDAYAAVLGEMVSDIAG